MTQYELSRRFWDFAFENPEKISPSHIAIYFFAMEHCNRLGNKDKFGLPTEMTKDAIGIRKSSTYIQYFNDLCDWGFFNLIEKSKNQYSANIISLISAIPKTGKALDKAIIRYGVKQTESMGLGMGISTGQSNGPVDKPTNQLTINKGPVAEATLFSPFDSEVFIPKWAEWVQYRKDIKKGFVNLKSQQRNLNSLVKIAKGRQDLAIAILDKTMAMQYQGIFELSKKEEDEIINGKEQVKAIPIEIQPQKDYSNLSDWDREVQEHFDRLTTDLEYKARKIESERIYSHENGKQMFIDYPEFFTADGKFKYPEFRP